MKIRVKPFEMGSTKEKNKVEAHVTTNEPNFVQQTTWEPDVARRIIVDTSVAARGGRPFMVALVGIPGSGKSVSSLILADQLQKQNPECCACVIPHDGYHYPLEQLKNLFLDADDAIYRRGASDTFDSSALYRDLLRIRDGNERVISIPGFDHATGDPEPDRHAIDRDRHSVVICEGLYLLYDQNGWENIASLFDFTVFIKSDVDFCIERLKVRNQCIPGYTPKEIAIRCERVDRVNAHTVMRCEGRANLVVDSLVGNPRKTQTEEALA